MVTNKNSRWTGRGLPIFLLLVMLVLLIAACRPAGVETPVTPTSSPSLTPIVSGDDSVSPGPATPSGSSQMDPQTPLPAVQPAPEQPTESPVFAVRLAVIGDYGLDGEPLAKVAALVKSWSPDAILTTGDNNYPEGAVETIDANIGQYFSEYIGNYQGSYGPGADSNRFFPVLGNHDLNTAQGQAYFDYFTLPGNERYYEVLLGPVHIFALNSDGREPDGVNQASVQAAWLQERLAASSANWKVVLLHAAPYASGITGPTDYMQWPFADWGASAVLSGHDHIYERLLVDGIPYFVNGLGGGPRYEIGDVLPESQVRYRDAHGAMLLEANASSIDFRFINVDGEEIDHYSLGKPLVNTPEETSAPVSAPSATSLPDPNLFNWQPFISGLDNPVGLVPLADGSGRLFVIEKPGMIQVIQDGQVQEAPFLDIRDRVGSNGFEQGLLGLAFHPNFVDNGRFYVNYTDKQGNTVISAFQVGSDGFPAAADEQHLLNIVQPYGNHNGGHILFGPDGYLYIGMGDGGSGGDPQGNAQNPKTLLGKMLRINVDGGQPYSIPTDNPYADGEAGLPEIFMIGLRNPWKFDFDPANGSLYLADVGQNQWEEVNYLPPGTAAGANLGWDYREGPFAFEGEPPVGLELVEPVAWYDHSQGCSITGGVAYRGELFPELNGVYVYADYCSGRIWGLLPGADGSWQNNQLFQLNAQVAAFAQSPSGELFVVDQAGTIYQLVRR